MPDEKDEKPDYLGMSDEDILKMNSPASSSDSDKPPEEKTQEDTQIVDDKAANKDDATSQAEKPEDKDEKSESDKPSDNEGKSDDAKSDVDPDKSTEANKDVPSKDAKASTEADAKLDAEGDKGKSDAKPDTANAEVITPQAFYDLVMKPFKANGREIKINSPDEAIRLMQMGAGYGRKLQELQPALKSLRLLEKHGLLDDKKLSYLIDLDQKNPDAIKKLIKDSGIDPLDLNTGDAVNYTSPNRTVSDQEMAFSSALKDLEGHPQGKATITEINTTWDQTSKKLLFNSPELLSVIQTQKDTGVYTLITAEIDRQKTLGLIPHSAPFLEAYKTAGDFLVKSGNLNPPPNSDEQPKTVPVTKITPEPKVVDTKAATPASTVKNDAQAKAAASTKTGSSRVAASKTNPLAMADDDFLKQMDGRL